MTDIATWCIQVYLPAIVSYVPDQMVQAIALFLDFCYLVRCPIINKSTLTQIDAAVK